VLGWALVVALGLMWINRAEAAPARWKRLAGMSSVCALAAASLSIWWQPSLRDELTLRTAAQRLPSSAPVDLPCDEVARAAQLLAEGSGGRAKIDEKGQLLLPRRLWEQMAPGDRLSLLELSRRAQACASDAGAAAGNGVLDIDTRVPLSVER